MPLSPLPRGSGPALVTCWLPCVLSGTQPSTLSREPHKSASEECYKEQHLMHFASFRGQALNPGCCSFQQCSKRSLFAFIKQAKKEQEVAVITITFCPLIQRLKHFSGHRLFKALARWYPGDRAAAEVGHSSVCWVTHTKSLQESLCLEGQ